MCHQEFNRNILDEGGWWKSKTLYDLPLSVNQYVRAAPNIDDSSTCWVPVVAAVDAILIFLMFS